MKVSELVQSLENIMEIYGNIEVQLQDEPEGGEMITDYESFFLVPEEYEENGESVVICNVRWWAY